MAKSLSRWISQILSASSPSGNASAEPGAGAAGSVESPTNTDPLFPRKAGPAISNDGLSRPDPVLRAHMPWESLAGLVALQAPRNGDSPPRQAWIMTTLGLPSSARQFWLLNFS